MKDYIWLEIHVHIVEVLLAEGLQSALKIKVKKVNRSKNKIWHGNKIEQFFATILTLHHWLTTFYLQHCSMYKKCEAIRDIQHETFSELKLLNIKNIQNSREINSE